MIITSHTGRARVPVVTGSDEGPAILTTLTAVAVDRREGPFMYFSGTSAFQKQTQDHLTEVVAPLIERIFARLGIVNRAVEIGVSNIGAAAQRDFSLEISGYSADTGVFIAALVALLALPSPMSLATTGHIASAAGDIVNVRATPAKVAAARGDADIKTFICPSFEDDRSIGVLTPDYQRRAMIAINEARVSLEVWQITDCAELVEKVFDPDDLVRSALLHGFYREGTASVPVVPSNRTAANASAPIDRIVDFIGRDGGRRFMASLERTLQTDRIEDARELLHLYCRHHIQLERYPDHFGRRLHALLASLSFLIRRRPVESPLIEIPTYSRLAQFADPSQQDDARLLFEASQNLIRKPRAEMIQSPSPDLNPDEVADREVEALIRGISAEGLAQKFGNRIDEARASFRLDRVQTESNDETLDVVAGYYLHLKRHTMDIPTTVTPVAVMDAAIELTEAAFHRERGLDGVYAEARDATRGGLRYILDVVTNEYRRRMQTRHVNAVLKQALDCRPFESRVRFMAALKQQLSPLMPEIRRFEPDQLARDSSSLVRELVRSTDDFKRLLRTY